MMFMNCIECGAQMHEGPVTLHGVYRGQRLSVEMERGFACSECEYKTIHGRDSSEFSSRLKEEYREANRRLDPAGFVDLRAMTGLSQNAYAKYLHVGPATVKRWEAGDIPDLALEDVAKWRSDPRRAEVELQDTYFRLNTLRGTLTELPAVERMVSEVWQSHSNNTVLAAEPWDSVLESILRSNLEEMFATLNSSAAIAGSEDKRAELLPEQALAA